MSSNSTSPGSIYGGTWASISGGRYMRAAGAWGNGGSNTITIKQMPAHQHNNTGTWLAESVAGGGAATGFDTYWGTGNLTYNRTPVQGGGNRSTLRTKMFGRGTELPREGDALCITFNKFKSVLQMALRKFVHSRLVTFICQPIQRVQPALTVVHGYLSQTVRFCGQAVRGILLEEQVQTRTITGCRSVKRTGYLVCRPHFLADGQMGRNMNYVRERLLTVFSRKTHIFRETMQTLQKQQPIQQLFQRFRLTAPVIVGIVQPNYIGGVY